MIIKIQKKGVFNMFNLGDVVSIISGNHEGMTGVIWKIPSNKNMNHYTVISESSPYGCWATENELAMKFSEGANKRSEDKAIRDAVYSIKLLNEKYDGYIPENMDPGMFFAEMAEIYTDYQKKNPNCKFRIFVYTNDGPIPHFHMKFKKGKDAIIKLFSAEYLNGHDSKELNSDEKKELIKFLNATMKDLDGNDITSWNQMINVWKSSLPGDETRTKAFKELAKKDKDGNYVMPDYTKLTYPEKKGHNFYQFLTTGNED